MPTPRDRGYRRRRYPDAPAMHVAHRSHVINMLDGEALRHVITEENRIISCRK